MRVLVELSEDAVVRLAELGLVDQVDLATARAPKRRQLSAATVRELKERLAELRWYHAQHGNYEVSRHGEHWKLGEWLDKLKETYRRRPDGYRTQWVREHEPQLHRFLCSWSTAVPLSTGTYGRRATPFWLSAAWTFQFMLERHRAPSQAVVDPVEVALSKWLSRWSCQAALERLRQKETRADIVKQLSSLAGMLRSRIHEEQSAAISELGLGYEHPVYRSLAMLCMCDGCDGWATDAWIATAIMNRERFWPTWSQWTGNASDSRTHLRPLEARK